MFYNSNMKFLYGEEDYLINLEAKKIENRFQDGIVTHYDTNDDFETILMDISTISMFAENKLIFIKNSKALENTKLAQELLDEVQHAMKHIDIVFLKEGTKIDKKNPLVSFLLSNADVSKFDKIDSKNIISTIKEIVAQRGGTITNSAAIKLAAKLPDNLRLIVTEIKKLINESPNITDKMIEVSIGDYVNDDYFGLTNAITSSDEQAIVASFRDRMNHGEPITMMIGQIASILNLALLVAAYRKQGLSSQDISNELKIHIFRIKKASEMLADSSEDNIKRLLLELAELDKNIKSGKIDEKSGINNFILNLIK